MKIDHISIAHFMICCLKHGISTVRFWSWKMAPGRILVSAVFGSTVVRPHHSSA
jgi:hypothetical protein